MNKKYRAIRQIGRQGKINIEANRKLRLLYQDKGLEKCEVGLSKCMRTFGLSFAHRHKRNWYYSKPELLSDFNQTILACASCHSELEKDKKLTEDVFKLLRD